MQNRFGQAIATGVTVLVLLAVPAFAILFADVDLFAQPAAQVAAHSGQVSDVPVDSLVLSNWQFTSNSRHSFHPRHSDHSRVTDHPRSTDHRRNSDHHVKQTDHRSQHTCCFCR